MPNIITGKYFTQGDFSKRAKTALGIVKAETRFIIKKEIFRGVIYDSSKVGSLIYRGYYQNKPAVLKLQGLKPQIDEMAMIIGFNKQNESKIIRVPEVYVYKKWNPQRGFGYLVEEYVKAPKLFTLPHASPKDMRVFCTFFQEYRTRAVRRSWIKPIAKNSLKLTVQRIKGWRKISEAKDRLKNSDHQPYLKRYWPLARRHLPSIPLTFCHGHLTANDVHRFPNGTYVLMSNLFWTYRPQWYELGFNIWSCLMHINDAKYTFNRLIKYVESWLAAYKKIPVVEKDKDFDRKITVLLLERVMGAILVDLGASGFFDRPSAHKLFKNQLRLQQQLFDYLEKKLEKI